MHSHHDNGIHDLVDPARPFLEFHHIAGRLGGGICVLPNVGDQGIDIHSVRCQQVLRRESFFHAQFGAISHALRGIAHPFAQGIRSFCSLRLDARGLVNLFDRS